MAGGLFRERLEFVMEKILRFVELVSQWIAKASRLTILEEMQADRLAA